MSRTTDRLSISLPKALKEALHEMSRERGVSVSALVASAIAQRVHEYENIREMLYELDIQNKRARGRPDRQYSVCEVRARDAFDSNGYALVRGDGKVVESFKTPAEALEMALLLGVNQ